MTATLAEPVAPTDAEAQMAKESSRRLTPYVKSDLRVEISGKGKKSEAIDLPAAAVRLLVRILTEMASGNAVALVRHHGEVSTQRAADLLNVSRPFLVKQLLDTGKIRHRKVGAHRRILLSDLLAFKRENEAAQAKALDQLVEQAQKLKMGY
jgi:excisionase family DNA binding protein